MRSAIQIVDCSFTNVEVVHMAVQPTRRQQQRVQRTMQRTTIAIFVEAELLQNDRIRNVSSVICSTSQYLMKGDVLFTR